jgi:DNA topoisomerase-1
MKTLIIVESGTKAKSIQDILGQEYLVEASVGHITELASGGSHGIGVDIDNDFKPHYVLSDDKVSVLKNLMNASKKCDRIIIASDPDREGEAIAWHLSKRLEDMGKPIKRMTYSKITKPALLKSLNELRDVDLNIFHAQEARRILDRLVGFSASPFLMNFFGPKLSAGRVQSVVTRMIIDRELEIEAFVPEEFYTIQVNLDKNGKEPFVTKYSGRLINAKVAKAMHDRLSANKEYIVTEVKAEEEKKPAPPPLITATLLQAMSSLHNLDPEETMKAAQSLFENKYISYHRTDSVRIEGETMKMAHDWLDQNNFSRPSKPNIFKNEDETQDAHECIHPCDVNFVIDNNNYEIVDKNEKLVYSTIWKYFVASQMLPAVYNTLKVTAHVSGDKSAEVKASGKALKSKGFLEILGVDDKNKIEIPNLEVGDLVYLSGKIPVRMEKKQTQPPPRYSINKVMSELKRRGIGRPATYADLLSKISARNYVEKKGNVFHATDLGKTITNVLSNYFTFMDYDYTAKMEKSLDEIESGKINHIDMLKKFYPGFKSELDKAYLGHGGTLCDKCSSPMSTRVAKSTGEKFLACSAFPKCRNTKSCK